MPYINLLDRAEFNTAAVHRFIVEECGFPVTLTKVELAAAAGELETVRATHHNRYSRRMALRWLESLGVAVDWDIANDEARRELARLAQREAEAELAELDS
ncbi:hypothetical protein [Mycolicibacterium rhodesiae]|uniref:Uncharacterized protein n=1 Tax=Mycolicibacterium rhodesiae TaxID=36814 RepID=A0A1X0IRT9_MYCRH|nr:hypothetical protein [Mycolicibacterium rhodesiae]MCV7343795.1 hypothetical protein [Mycolicibacterium rhodesiae]ORB51275.1 hypothetical protein BST42_17810 [Mycolicibacterium rhodesiae]